LKNKTLLLKLIAQFSFWLTGWKKVGEYPENIPKSVMIAAPHTSNWDFFYARAAFFLLNIPVKTTIKKEAMFFPMNLILKFFGVIPIDRTKKAGGLTKKNSMVDAMVNLFEQRDELVIMITPEGTRRYVPKWKTGFYHVAKRANVPIILGYLDYQKKHAGIGPVVWPGDDIEKDLEFILDFYRGVSGKYPAQGVR
jgi:1-acyl-sn-glycerol-3-phosphate acyltransferase